MLEHNPAHARPRPPLFEDAPVFRHTAHTLGIPGSDVRPGAVLAPFVIPDYLEVTYPEPGQAAVLMLPGALIRHVPPVAPPTRPLILPSPYDQARPR